jgi:hypothetical protein
VAPARVTGVTRVSKERRKVENQWEHSGPEQKGTGRRSKERAECIFRKVSRRKMMWKGIERKRTALDAYFGGDISPAHDSGGGAKRVAKDCSNGDNVDVLEER